MEKQELHYNTGIAIKFVRIRYELERSVLLKELQERGVSITKKEWECVESGDSLLTWDQYQQVLNVLGSIDDVLVHDRIQAIARSTEIPKAR